VGIIGCGNIGRIHSRALWALRKTGVADATVAAVSDPDSDRAAELAAHNGAEVLTPEELLDAVEAVYVCTPTAYHPDIVEAAAGRGLPIYCEKPLACDLAGAVRVAAALATVPHRVGLVLRCVPLFEAMADALASHRYGTTMTVLLRDDQYFPVQGQYASAWRSQHEMTGGGTLIEHSIHDIDVFRWLCGDPVEVSCRTSSFFEYPGIEDAAGRDLLAASASVDGQRQDGTASRRDVRRFGHRSRGVSGMGGRDTRPEGISSGAR
jgi:myo-inositol 2-dehydrogenase/D-chiro-inositol 1-dehydrogenase